MARLGLLDPDGGLYPEAGDELDTLGTCHAAAIAGQIPFGPRAGQQALLWGEAEGVRTDTPRPSKKRCGYFRGYSPHVGARISACNAARRERLCRHVARPLLAQERLPVTPRGDVVYRFLRRWRNGEQSVVMTR